MDSKPPSLVLLPPDIELETVQPTIQPDLSQSLLTLIADISVSKNLASIILSETEISILKELLSISPSSLDEINTCILEIIKDGKIDVLDIPPLIKIIKNIYILSHQQITVKVNDLVITIGSILKYILQIILVKSNLSSPELIKSCDGLIDIAVDMIQLSNSFKKPKTCLFKLC